MFQRLGFGVLGAFGMATVIPNSMINSNGNLKLASQTGLAASFLMTLSGIVGISRHSICLPVNIAKCIGLLGLSAQMLTFLLITSKA